MCLGYEDRCCVTGAPASEGMGAGGMPEPIGVPVGAIFDVVRRWMSEDDGYESFLEQAARCAGRIRSIAAQAGRRIPSLKYVFPANGWGGRSRCRNAVIQALFGSWCKSHWAVFTYDSGMGVVDHNGEVHLYEWKDVKRISTNFFDAGMLRVVIRKGRHLDFRFGGDFTAINPNRLLSEDMASAGTD